MDPVWLGIAFVLGYAARRAGLPPLVGYLVAGFVLHAMGVEGGEVLEEVAEIGVTLLLFSIGLKLRIQSLMRPEVWAVASLHMLIVVASVAGVLIGIGAWGLGSGMGVTKALLLGFALSFSSTVFAVKILEERGEMSSRHGHVAIGILIMQDLFAVIFLTTTLGKLPSPWALLLLGLIPLRPLLVRIMERAGHGELQILYGLALALGGAAIFDSVGVKADLGALILGMLVASSPRAAELAKALLGFKDLFLIGFFLTIGLSGLPDLKSIGVAGLLVVLVPFKVVLFFILLTRFKLRARTALFSSLSLANYSEFGLIVGAVSAQLGWIDQEWLQIIAISVALTFVLASPLNISAHTLYARFDRWLRPFQTRQRLPGDRPISAGDAEILIFGMGRVGTGAYEVLWKRFGRNVLGVDFDTQVVGKHIKDGRNVIIGDATDPDFWENLNHDKVRLVMLAMPNHQENMYTVNRLKEYGYKGRAAAIAKYADQARELEAAGIHAVYNVYAEAGAGFANHVCDRLEVS